MFVYITRFEVPRAYNSGVKAVSSLMGYYADLTEYSKIAPGSDYMQDLVEITEETVNQVTAFLHNHENLRVYMDKANQCDNYQVDKLVVR